ncbi:MAG TPA: thioredoxin family protein [Candidatus Saccharicenans sp.]|jgi:glutaredoxin-like protein|nr:thioredoxin family protein [Candidatus Saccharicenans sp.]HOJ25680.1 thioredoxin family protein [Candidatus Saccharicenans sp.]HOL44861.1 thioredoxin family protein [Candidatus Saccharicenans sp.]HOM94356.1 thioredoxin family protein [Candidatus Saccharicenans sp.]HOP60883.1 thioredoxin family protein [Candidatus Saccharicenans sp.]
MEMLNEEVRDFTRKKFAEELVNPVELIFFMEEKSPLIVPGQPVSTDCQYCPEIKQLLEELSSLSDRIKLTVYDFKKEAARAAEYRLDKIPAIIIKTEIDTGIRFFGIPSGYEYMSLLEAIVDASRGQTELSPATREALKKLKKEVDIQVFVTPTCPYCPMAVRLAHQMALESPLITASMIEAAEFPELTQKYEVMGVPKSIFNETISLEGAVPEEVYLEQVLKAAGEQAG